MESHINNISSLVEELREYLRNVGVDEDWDDVVDGIDKILSRCRPSKTEEIMETIKALMDDNKKHGDEDYEAQLWQIREIIRKFEGESK